MVLALAQSEVVPAMFAGVASQLLNPLGKGVPGLPKPGPPLAGLSGELAPSKKLWLKIFRPGVRSTMRLGFCVVTRAWPFSLSREVVAADINLEVVVRLPAQGAAQGKGIIIPCIHTIERVDHETILVELGDGRIHVKIVAEREIDLAEYIDPVIDAHSHTHLAFKFLMGFLGMDSDGAARGITAEQGALGAAQDFNTVNVDYVQHRTRNRHRPRRCLHPGRRKAESRVVRHRAETRLHCCRRRRWC